jgi:hypothetical protein
MNAFVFGTCRLRMLPFPQCLTFVHSVPQLLWWMRVIDHTFPSPPEEWRKLICHDHAHDETFNYDLWRVDTFVIEVSSLKTVWDKGYPIHLSMMDHARPQSALVTQDREDLVSSLCRLRRTADRPLVFVCQQTVTADIASRRTIRDGIWDFLDKQPDCQLVDPTVLIEEHGRDKCVYDDWHWTDWGAEQLRTLILEAMR